MRLLLATVLCVLALTASAQAWTPQGWAASVDVARISWPDSPCMGREQITVTTDLQAGAGGQAHMDGTCRVDIRPGFTDYALCVVMVHEFGHLAGRTHADVNDHEGVMAAAPQTYSPCDAVAPQITARALAAELFTISPRRCVLSRAAPAWRLYRCGRRQHALVEMSGGLAVTADRL